MVGLFKTSLKSEIVFFSRIRRRCLSCECVFLVNHLVSLKCRLNSGDSTFAIEISRLESELKALISKEFEGSKARSRVRWFEDGERPTRYLFKLRTRCPQFCYLHFGFQWCWGFFSRRERVSSRAFLFQSFSSRSDWCCLQANLLEQRW